MCNDLKFTKPSEAINQFSNNKITGIYFVAIDEKNRDIFITINKNLHEDLKRQKQYECDKGYILLYIGQAKGQGGLQKRLSQEFMQKGAATFFRSVGAVLMKKPIRGQNNPKNYKFRGCEKDDIIAFMEEYFLIAFKPYNVDEIDQHEMQLINQHKPIFNITHNPNPSEEVKKQRKRCRDIASEAN